MTEFGNTGPTVGTGAAAEGPSTPKSASGRRPPAKAGAAVWLLLSLVAGVWFALGGVSTADVGSSGRAKDVSAPQIRSSASYETYGGDAYTGIQNAAVDTEHAVVDGFNALAELQSELARVNAQSAATLAESNAELQRDLFRRLEIGLAIVIVGVAVANFCVVSARLERSAAA